MSGAATCFASVGAGQQLFASAIGFLAASQCIVPDKESPYDAVPDQDTFDFIVVGGGSAGSVVANRLSEIGDWNVLLLEAGSEPPIESNVPQLYAALNQTKYDWSYFTKSETEKLQALKNATVPWPRGKMLGGTSSINAMFYVKGRNYDFDGWAKQGNPSWTSKNVNFYYNKAENFQDMNLLKNSEIRKNYGQKGPLVVQTFNSTYREIINNVIDSYDRIGIKKEIDMNSAKFKGYGFSGISRVTARSGERESTYTAYLKKAENRPNLNIVTNAFVTKILLNDKAKAYGVEVDIKGTRKTFKVNFEVIISAGVINTPQLLMLSGIGPKEHLLSKNIPSIVDLPGVGENLHDHSSLFIPIYGDQPGFEDVPTQLFEAVKYLYNKSGLFANGVISDFLSFFSSKKDMPYPEFESYLLLFLKNSSFVQPFFSIFKDEVAESLTKDNSNKSMYLTLLSVLHPKSRGRVRVKSNDPFEHPDIEANYNYDERDVQTTLKGIKILTNLLKTPFFKSINAFIPRVNFAPCNVHKFQSDDYWKCYIIHTTASIYHPVGTAKMGPDPADSVVDDVLKVHGVDGLRIMDDSIMPTATSGNTNAPAIMIGEMGSDMIKFEYIKNYSA